MLLYEDEGVGLILIQIQRYGFAENISKSDVKAIIYSYVENCLLIDTHRSNTIEKYKSKKS